MSDSNAPNLSTVRGPVDEDSVLGAVAGRGADVGAAVDEGPVGADSDECDGGGVAGNPSKRRIS